MVSNSNNIVGTPNGLGAWPIDAAMSFDRGAEAESGIEESGV